MILKLNLQFKFVSHLRRVRWQELGESGADIKRLLLIHSRIQRRQYEQK